MAPTVVVTGLGIVSLIGVGEFWKNAVAGRSGITKLRSFERLPAETSSKTSDPKSTPGRSKGATPATKKRHGKSRPQAGIKKCSSRTTASARKRAALAKPQTKKS